MGGTGVSCATSSGAPVSVEVAPLFPSFSGENVFMLVQTSFAESFSRLPDRCSDPGIVMEKDRRAERFR